MVVQVTDSSSNKPEQISGFAEALKTSAPLRTVFRAIYAGKKQPKTTEDLMDATGLNQVRILQLTKKLESESLIRVEKEKGKRVFYKVDFVNHRKDTILRLAENPKSLAKLATKARPIVKVVNEVSVSFPKPFIQVSQITVDDIDSFSAVKTISPSSVSIREISEIPFKRGIQAVIGEQGVFTDWGGERNDLCTTRMVYEGKRIATSFAFKGKGTKGALNPKKMGKNGDQIPRLFEGASTLFVLQYWNHVEESVVNLMTSLAQAKSALEQRPIYFCVIDGVDSQRLIEAYPTELSKVSPK